VCSPTGACEPAPRRGANIFDCGYAAPEPRGWYDAQKQGARNDYCRTVGPPQGKRFSCALAGTDTPNTPQGMIIDPRAEHDPEGPGDFCWQKRGLQG
jgi:hypothetical protein